ncbi:MAG: HDIG domain-containing protein [Nitrospinae bacterium]|nr:HDIG domain-containing protein [Nitrospinota bacterium]
MAENTGSFGGQKSPSGGSSRLKRAAAVPVAAYEACVRSVGTLKEGLDRFFADDGRFYAALAAVTFAALAAIIIPSAQLASEKFAAGDIASRSVYAPSDMTVDDAGATARRRDQAAEAVRDVYYLDPGMSRILGEKIKRAFSLVQDGYEHYVPEAYEFVMREFDEREMMDFGRAEEGRTRRREAFHDALRAYESSPGFAALERKFWGTLGVEPTDDTAAVMRAYHYRPNISEWLYMAVSEALQTGVVENKSRLPASSHNGLTEVNAETGERIGLLDFQDVLELRETPGFIRSRVGEMMASQPLSLQKAVVEMAEAVARPNLAFNRTKTLELKKAARDAVSPVAHKVRKGELVVREGEIITPEHVAKLDLMRSGLNIVAKAEAAGGALVFITLAVFSCGLYIRRYMPEFTEVRANAALLAVMLAAQAAFYRLFAYAGELLSGHGPGSSASSYLYAAPYALAPIMAAIFFTREAVLITAVVSALLAGVILNPAHHNVIFALAGGVTAVFHVGAFARRSDVWRVGIRLTLVNMAALAMIQMLDGRLFMSDSLSDFAFCAAGGFVTVALALTLTPLVEAYFPVVSGFKLMELQDLNHPLLARMALVAPGTYHHSIIVGNLAEDAAEAIGASPLLARVGAYFHDIGKIHKPEYFIENQRDGVNRHDALSPNMSVLIITSHVSKGLELAREYKLIPQIRAIIEEHHGTSLIQYFYHRASEMEKEGQVNEQNFRYPGRRPRTRESAIVALADSVEAATRALKNPASSRLRQVVSKIINDKFVTGELDDSHLTLSDLSKIGDSFVRILHGIFHYRVVYPGGRNDDENQNTDNVKAIGQASEHRQDKEKAPINLKRIG